MGRHEAQGATLSGEWGCSHAHKSAVVHPQVALFFRMLALQTPTSPSMLPLSLRARVATIALGGCECAYRRHLNSSIRERAAFFVLTLQCAWQASPRGESRAHARVPHHGGGVALGRKRGGGGWMVSVRLRSPCYLPKLKCAGRSSHSQMGGCAPPSSSETARISHDFSGIFFTFFIYLFIFFFSVFCFLY